MFPLIAVGALVTGTLLLSASASESSKTKQKSADAGSKSAASPQAYVVVPVNDAERPTRQVETVSLVEQVRKFIF